MAVITVDIESFYSQEYSLSRMSEVAYVLDDRFQTIMAAIKVDGEKPELAVGDDAVARRFAEIDWSGAALLSHNVRFDGAILCWRYGYVPKLYLDTLSMCRATTHWTLGRSSLGKVAEYLGLEAKGDEVVRAKGKRLEDFDDVELKAYASYCRHDADLAYQIFQRLRPAFRASEIYLIDLVARMFILPQVRLNTEVLEENYTQVQRAKADAMDAVSCIEPRKLASNQQFAELLREQGVEIPMKISPSTGKPIPALAKGDPGFKALCQDESQPMFVQALLAARTAVKSTLEETRSRNLLELSRRHWPGNGRGWAPISLKYSGARTHRLSGDGGLNWQNLPRGSLLRTAIEAPPGWRIVHRDQSQVEARMTAWMARCDVLLDAFAEGRDVYSEFGSIVYGRQITKEDKLERFVGKTCLAAGTRVLTNRGPVPIQEVNTTDLVWDGVGWVHHDGLIAQGLRETLTLSGVCLTPDHHVWCGSRWETASEAGRNGRFPRSAIAAANLPLQGTSLASRNAGYRRWWSGATVALLNIRSIAVTSRILKALAATRAQSLRLRRSDTGNTPTRCPTTCTVLGYSIDWLLRLPDAIQNRPGTMCTMAYAGSTFTLIGSQTGLHSCTTSRRCQGGTTRRWKWIASTTTATTNRVTCASSPGASTKGTLARLPISRRASESLRPVYDLANAGPRHRFTILSDDGPVIVSNCILGLGYGCGPERFQQMLFIGNGGISVKVELAKAQEIVWRYRDTYPEIGALWSHIGLMLNEIVSFSRKVRGGGRRGRGNWEHIPVEPDYDSFLLPNDLRICYPNIRQHDYPDEQARFALVYDDPYSKEPKKIYGAKGVENASQALSRIIVTDIALRVQQLSGYRPFLSTHDSLDYVVPASDAEALDAELEHQFAVVPVWGEGLPLASEGGWGRNLTAAEKRENS